MAEQTLAPPQEAAQEPMPVTKPEEHREETTLSEYLESLLVTVILALFGTTFIVQAFKIPSASMEGTLLIGDHLLVNKFIFGGTGAWYEKFLPYRPLQRGDIIVFKFPYQEHQHFVKRVIGLPGDRVKVVDQNVYVNGKLMKLLCRQGSILPWGTIATRAGTADSGVSWITTPSWGGLS